MNYENGVQTNELGAKQSNIETRFDLVDPLAMLEMANVLYHGEIKWGEDNWRGFDVNKHLNHAETHINKYYLTNDINELTHAFCRLMFAVAKHKRPDYLGKFVPKAKEVVLPDNDLYKIDKTKDSFPETTVISGITHNGHEFSFVGHTTPEFKEQMPKIVEQMKKQAEDEAKDKVKVIYTDGTLNLNNFTRNVKAQKAYDKRLKEIKKEGKTPTDVILEQIGGSHKDWGYTKNEYPYILPPRHSHNILWFKPKTFWANAELHTFARFLPTKIQDFVAIFENPRSKRSVKGLRHYHVIVKN